MRITSKGVPHFVVKLLNTYCRFASIWTVGHPLGVLRHQQRRLVQQLHVHVDVVNAVVGQVVHLHVGVHTVERLDDLVDVVLRGSGNVVHQDWSPLFSSRMSSEANAVP